MARFLRTILFTGILFCFCAISFGANQPDGLFIRTGINMPAGKWATGYLIEADLQLGEVLPELYLQPFVGFRHNSYSVSSAGSTKDLALSDVSFGTKLIHYYGIHARGPYTGASVAYDILNYEQAFTQPRLQVQQKAEQKVSLSIIAGYSGRIAGIEPVIETKYNFLPGGFTSFIITAGIFIDF